MRYLLSSQERPTYFRSLILTLLTTLFLSTSTASLAKDIVVYGASGNFGSDIVTEALNRGHNVVGVSRSPERLTVDHPNFTAVKGDVSVLDSMVEIITGADAVIMSLRGNGADNSAEETATYKGAATYIEAAAALGKDTPPVFQVGNQATLYTDGAIGFERGVAQNRYSDGSAMYGRVYAHLLIIDLYEASTEDLHWTLFAPSGSIGPGERTGSYKTGSREIEGRGTGISQQDFAIAFIDQVENSTAPRQVISIGY